jgi:hypothetical protein
MEMYQAGRDHILKATRRVDANVYVKTEQKKLIYFTLIIEEVQSASRLSINQFFLSTRDRARLTVYILHIV